MLRVAIKCSALFAVLFEITQAFSSEIEAWKIPEANYTCIVDNIQLYKMVESDPVLIFVEDCPQTDVDEILAKRTINSLPTVKPKPRDDGDWDRAVVFSKKDLVCAFSAASSTDGGMKLVPKKPCG